MLYHMITVTGEQAYLQSLQEIRMIVQRLRATKYAYAVVLAKIYLIQAEATPAARPRCTSYHTIYTPPGKPVRPGCAIRMQMLMRGTASISTSDDGLQSETGLHSAEFDECLPG